MKVIIEIKKQLFKDFYAVGATALGIFLVYSTGLIIEKKLHASKKSEASSFDVAKEIYKNKGIKGFFKGTTFALGYKVIVETVKDVQKKIFFDSNGNFKSGEAIAEKDNGNKLINKIKNKIKIKKNITPSAVSIESPTILNSGLNKITKKLNSIYIYLNNDVYKLELLNIVNVVLECPLYLIRDCFLISPNKFKFKEFFKSIKTFKVIKLFAYYAGVSILKSYSDTLIDAIVQEIQNNCEKKPNSLFNYLKFVIIINNNIILKSYFQSLILCPLDYIKIQYSLKVVESMDLGITVGAYKETQIQSPFAIIKKSGLSELYKAFNISFINNILSNVLSKYLDNMELVLNLIAIKKNITKK
ncbi:hypothetical protein DICPUDRAFT_74903 [Dictyostelium purpureum]|uniref:Uncharacterized protein n=1 Tax=Dictyostelium purpureum TaxID=5786 RepID=F0Z929_DICPU|nr:uncharacterized protein DICPUDRAFT_74903 [Dictyostelium purpureum]EGC39558.1 hypothetical protein DICPUDRAFT_74903 [Dictyostelium purpureum]|eukprot:XP_003283893.1 hypothetical protein DICPUDRAFT_74903 [Dictyostelium purpureum]